MVLPMAGKIIPMCATFRSFNKRICKLIEILLLKNADSHPEIACPFVLILDYFVFSAYWICGFRDKQGAQRPHDEIFQGNSFFISGLFLFC